MEYYISLQCKDSSIYDNMNGSRKQEITVSSHAHLETHGNSGKWLPVTKWKSGARE